MHLFLVDPNLEKKLIEKIAEVTARSDEIFKIISSLGKMHDNPDSFAYGIAIGRLYNSFYYQCRRILRRDPTEKEFAEFVELLEKKQNEILDALGLG